MFVDLAMHAEDGYVALSDIAERQNISKKYLEQIVLALSGSGILKTNRGFRGGYMLVRPPEECSVGEILRLTEGSMAPVACLDCVPAGCERRDKCPTLYVWQELDRVISEYLDGITVADIVAAQERGDKDGG